MSTSPVRCTAAALSPPTHTGHILVAAIDACLKVQTQTGDILLPAMDQCLPVQTAEVGTTAPAAAPISTDTNW